MIKLSLDDKAGNDAELRSFDIREGRWSFLWMFVFFAFWVVAWSYGVGVGVVGVGTFRLCIYGLIPLGFGFLGATASLPFFIQAWFGSASTDVNSDDRRTVFRVSFAGRVTFFSIAVGMFFVGIACLYGGRPAGGGLAPDGERVYAVALKAAGIVTLLAAALWAIFAVMWCRAWNDGERTKAAASTPEPKLP